MLRRIWNALWPPLPPPSPPSPPDLAADMRVEAWVEFRQRFPCPKCHGTGNSPAGLDDIVRCSYCKGTAIDLRRVIREG